MALRFLGFLVLVLTWDSNPQPVDGYKLYQGSKSQVYTNAFDFGQSRTNKVPTPPVGATFYYAVTAHKDGIESTFSAELVYTTMLFTLRILNSPDLSNWVVLTNLTIQTSVEQGFYKLEIVR